MEVPMRTRLLLVAVVVCLATLALGSTASAAQKNDDRSIVTACTDRGASFEGILRRLDLRDRIDDRVLQRYDRRGCWDGSARSLDRQECQSILRWLESRGCTVGRDDPWESWIDRWLDVRTGSGSRVVGQMDPDDCRTMTRWLERHGCSVDRRDDRYGQGDLWWLLRRTDRWDWFDDMDLRRAERRWGDPDRDDLGRADLYRILRWLEG